MRFAVVSLMVAASFAGTSLAGAAISPAGASAPQCQPWNGVEPTSGLLTGVAVLPSSCEEWAVGSIRQTLALHLYGRAWTQVPSPDPGGPSRTNSLNGVASVATDNAWAVGNYDNGTASRTLIVHWDGATWTRARSPNPGGPTHFSGLFGVAATSAHNAWAVGNYSNGKVRQTLILRWNGQSWSQVRSPNPGGPRHDNKLTSVAVISARDAWAVGYYQTARAFRQTLILHWDGRTWKQLASPDPGGPSHGNLLFGVAATSARNAWAVGYDTAHSGATTLVLHWNGRSWTRVPSPNRLLGGPPHINQLQAVAATSTGNAWAVGYYQISGGESFTLTLRWNGTTWTRVRSPNPVGDNDFLVGVAVASASSAWAIGGYNAGTGEQCLILHWDGTSWRS
jgi:hypothetical protein